MELLTIHTLHVIHDPDRTDRYKVLMDELHEQEINDWYLWDAIYDERGTYHGINKAHKQIVRWAKQNDLPYVTIAEDDLKFFDKGSYQYYLNNVPKNFDLYLGGIFLGTLDENNEVGMFTGLTLYRVDKKYYDTFLNAEENEHLDIALGCQKGKFVVCNPFVVRQYNGFSTNEKRYMNYDIMFSNRNVYKKI